MKERGPPRSQAISRPEKQPDNRPLVVDHDPRCWGCQVQSTVGPLSVQDPGSFRSRLRRCLELTRFGGRFLYAAFLPAFFTECISSNSIGLL